jgi:Uncharacterized conserved domain (SAYSvFN)/UBA-like domain
MWYEKERLSEFARQTGESNGKVALSLLRRHRWDLTSAVDDYLGETSRRQESEELERRQQFDERRQTTYLSDLPFVRQHLPARLLFLSKISIRMFVEGCTLLALWALAAYIEFAQVYVCLAIIYCIVRSMRRGVKRRQGELSAYAALNPGAQALPGDLVQANADFFRRFRFT